MLSVKCITYEGNFPFGLGGITPLDMSDEQVVMYGTMQGMQRARQTKTAKVLRILPKAAIGAFILGNAIKKPGKFSDKVGDALSTTAQFAFLGAGFKIFDKIKTRHVDTSSHAQKFRQEHPTTSAVLNLGGIFLVLGAALFGARGLANLAAKKCPKITQNITQELRKAADFIDKKPVAKGVEDFKIKYQNFAQKRGGIYKFAAENVFPLGLLAYMGAAFGLAKKNSDEKGEFIKQGIIETAQKRDFINFMTGG